MNRAKPPDDPPLPLDPAAALQESEARYRLLVEHAPDAIVMLDLSHGRFIDCNQIAAALFETDRATLVQYGPASLSPPRQPDGRPSEVAARDYIQRCLDGEFPSFEWTHRTLAGRDIPCEVRLVRMPAEGRVLVRGSITDISRRKGLEQERERLTARLQASQKLESLGLMAGGIAHDFNNLLSVIVGYADLGLSDPGLADQTRDALERLRRATDQARGLTDQLLVYTGQGTTAHVPVGLNGLVADELALLAVAVGPRATVVADLDEPDPRVAGNAGQLQQVVMNLVGNATQALGDPHQQIRVRTGRVQVDDGALQAFQVQADALVPGTYALIEVADDGCGMNPDVLARIFDPFFTTRADGHGLGLAAVAGIVRSHGGAVRVTSTVGAGSVFTVLLPTTSAPVAAAGAARASDGWRGHGRALVVDDEPIVREVTQALLEALGFQVEALASGQAAVARVREDPGAFRLALLDMSMVGMDGPELRQALRTLAPALQVLMVSGFARDEAMALLREAGPVAFLQKPYGLGELQAELRDLLGPG